jgi:hypothetical protein
MSAWSSARRGVACHPVVAFMLISLGIGLVMAAIPPIVDSEILAFGLPFDGVGMSLGAGLAAFLVTAALSGAPVSPTSHAAVCAGGSLCAGT